MPSQRAIGLRREAAIRQIETVLPGIAIPRQFNHRQRGMEDVVILEAIAEHLNSDDLEVAVAADGDAEQLPDYDSMTKDELTVLINEMGIADTIVPTGSNGTVLKADMVTALYNAEKATDGDAE